MNKKLLVILATVAMLVIGISAVSAQGGPNGNNICDPLQPDDCITEPQMNAFNSGGIGFVNPQTGEQWNGQQRGQMGRGTGVNGTGLYTTLPPAYDGELPQEIIDLMIDGWVDEQHAYAVYEAVIGQFGSVAPFASIQQAEVQHIAAWELLFDRYDIAVPDVPEFDVPELATLADACSAAADAEIANFDLYDTMLDEFVEYPDVHQIALSLRNASEFNHLPAFEVCAN